MYIHFYGTVWARRRFRRERDGRGLVSYLNELLLMTIVRVRTSRGQFSKKIMFFYVNIDIVFCFFVFLSGIRIRVF
jgi:hypothetical protein